jgi:hypothetical protein
MIYGVLTQGAGRSSGRAALVLRLAPVSVVRARPPAERDGAVLSHTVIEIV